jgi:biotin transport system substrate-specific component
MALAMAVFTGLLAQVRIPLAFTPVPITGQVFAVLLSGVLLGARYGAISQSIYAGLGVAGVPWFAGWSAGLAYFQGATGGYIIGFVVAAALIGWCTEKHSSWRGFRHQLILMFTGVLIIYACGTAWLSLLIRTDFSQILWLAISPFIFLDVCKAIIAAAISSAILPRGDPARAVKEDMH